MSITDLSDRNAVLRAIEEYDKLGRDGFLKRYGYRWARTHQLIYQGRKYPSKAIAAVAYWYQFPNRGLLKSGVFSGGKGTVVPTLKSLGFEVGLYRGEESENISKEATNIPVEFHTTDDDLKSSRHGNYTQEREVVFANKSLDEIVSEIEKRRKTAQ
ncbi:MAG: hypothetical protein L0Z70_04015 [Chloroflexi bacterium]|nr:hypothetical protein [Chloroflexota bacterium]